MIENILDYAVLDVYCRLCMKDVDPGSGAALSRPRFDPWIVERISELIGPGQEHLILPDEIVARNLQCHMNDQEEFENKLAPIHSNGRAGEETIKCGVLRFSWSDAVGRTHRENGPAVISLQGLRKWHAAGELSHLRCKSARFEWLQNALYLRPSGPFMIDVRDLVIYMEDGNVAKATVESMSFRWAIDGVEIPSDNVRRVIKKFGLHLDMYSSGPSVFQSTVDEFNFYNELLSLTERDNP